MKYIKYFENISVIQDKLTEQFDEDYIKNYFRDNYIIDVNEIIEEYGTEPIWDYFDGESFLEDFIQNKIELSSIYNFDHEDYENYIIDTLDENKEIEILKIYKDNNYIDEYKEIDFDFSMISELNTNQLRNVIKDVNEEDIFIETVIKNEYGNEDYKELINEVYGENSSTYARVNLNAINFLKKYIDSIDLIKNFKENTNFDTKYSFLKKSIVHDISLQELLLDMNKSNVFLLSELFEDKKINKKLRMDISCFYNFQKAYIEEYLKKKGDESFTRASALKYLNELCTKGLNDKIKSEYEDDMWMILSEPYNL